MIIRDLCIHIVDNRGKTPPLVKNGHPLVEAQSFSNKDYIYRKDAVKFVDNGTYSSFRTGVCFKGDIAVTLVGNIGHCSYVMEEFAIAQNIVAIRLNPKLIDNKFFFYYTKTSYFKNKCIQLNRSSVQPSLNVNDFLDLDISLPDLKTQKRISNLIWNIDMKKELNNDINLELESMAKTIYDYWFLQFEFPNEEGKPYKSSGGKMIYSEELKREIPEGWEVGNLYNIADFINGLACQKFRPTDDKHKLPVIKIGEMHDGFGSDVEWTRDDIPEKNIIHNGDILFSWSATLETMIWNKGTGALNQHIFKVVPKHYNKYYVFQQLSAYIINFIKMAEARKTTMGHITTDHLKQSRIVLPPKKLTDLFGSKVDSLYNLLLNNSSQNIQLAELRVFLLPMLMNGQVKI